jgi:Fe-S oxidoreductase
MRDPDLTVLDPPAGHLDEAAVRGELARVFDVCAGCRRCLDRCDLFPGLVDIVEWVGEAGMMTPADQDRVVDACHGCGACRHGCPFAPGVHDAAVDVPSLVLRSAAMRRASGQQPPADRRASLVLGDRRRWTLLASLPAPVRRFAARSIGLGSRRMATLVRSARVRSGRMATVAGATDGAIAAAVIVPTCLTEAFRPGVRHDIAAAAGTLGVTCRTSYGGCCGAGALHAGDLRRFRRSARRMVADLDVHVAAGAVVVVPEAACAEVMRRHHPEVLGGATAARVAAAVIGPIEFLSRAVGGVDSLVPPSTAGGERILLVAGPSGPDGSETRAAVATLEALGNTVVVAEEGTGVAGPWGLRAGNDPVASGAWARLAARAAAVGADRVLSGDVVWPVGPDGIGEPSAVGHPAEVVARAIVS